jgi:Holliday junction resolvase-like predicted endonuclease
MTVDFQSLSGQQGKHYENHVRMILGFRSWTLLSETPVKVEGGEVDIVALDPHGTLWWIECKGSYRDQPGLLRPDTLKKAIATAWLIKQYNPERPAYMLVTTNLPAPDSNAAKYLRTAIGEGLFDRVEEVN